jgi:flavin reductase (DIM6/NTAB) family NADH-FMN oxidoreductase RutF
MPNTRLFDSRELRRALGAFVTGVTVVTTTDGEGRFHGVTANSFSSVSLDPPLVLWSQAVKTQSHSTFFKAERFAVNILAEDQIELSNRFAKSSPEKFAGLEVDVGLGGIPLLRGCNAWLQCRVVPGCPVAIIRFTSARWIRSSESSGSRLSSGMANICALVLMTSAVARHRLIPSTLNSPRCG